MILLDSRKKYRKTKKTIFWVSSCRQVNSVDNFRQVLTMANINYTVLVIELSRESFARTSGRSSIVSGCHVRHKGSNASRLGHTNEAWHISVA